MGYNDAERDGDPAQTITSLLGFLRRRMLHPSASTTWTRIPGNLALLAIFFASTCAIRANPIHCAAADTTPSASRPNVLLFLVDDLGWADLSCYGSTFHETPNIDALAQSGTQFSNAYAACPVCSPTRASIITGRHPVRVGITDWLPGMDATRVKDRRFEHVDDRENLALEETTLAEVLRAEAGYQTFFLGKWHLGGEGFLPTDQGFDVNIGGGHKGSPPGGYYSPWKNPYLQAKHDGEYLTTRLTDEAVSLVESASEKQRPFFMMMSYYNVHSPITADKRTIDHYEQKRSGNNELSGDTPTIEERDAVTRGRQDNPDYASMVAAVDTSVGRILKSLKDQGVADNTLVIFFSDNGGLSTLRRMGPTCNTPLRAGKGWLYEGGIREPLLIRLPRSFTSNKEQPPKIDSVACSTDLFPTVLEVVGLPLQPELHADGSSLLGQLQGQAASDRDLFWHYPHYHGSLWRPGAAMRSGNYKLIEFYETDSAELYDLSIDIGETHNLAKSQPERFREMRDALRQWQHRMGATMPTPRSSSSN